MLRLLLFRAPIHLSPTHLRVGLLAFTYLGSARNVESYPYSSLYIIPNGTFIAYLRAVSKINGAFCGLIHHTVHGVFGKHSCYSMLYQHKPHMKP